MRINSSTKKGWITEEALMIFSLFDNGSGVFLASYAARVCKVSGILSTERRCSLPG